MEASCSGRWTLLPARLRGRGAHRAERAPACGRAGRGAGAMTPTSAPPQGCAWVLRHATPRVRPSSRRGALIAAEATLAHLDTRAGDGDCGATMRRGAECVKAAMCKLDGDVFSPGALAASCASIAMSDMGGTSGALYSILFAAVKAALMGASTTEEASGAAAFGVLSSGFSAGVAAVSSYGGATVGDRTMLDALVPAANVMAEMFGSGASAVEALAAAAAAADAGARTTAGMAARRSQLVRGGWALSEEDAGARAAAIMLGGRGRTVKPMGLRVSWADVLDPKGRPQRAMAARAVCIALDCYSSSLLSPPQRAKSCRTGVLCCT